MWPEIDFRGDQMFLVLAEELHFGRAAERLEVTQARVSQTIRALEIRLGGPLFERTSRRVALTPFGVEVEGGLRPAYRQVKAALEDAVATVSELAGVLRVGVTTTSDSPALHELADRFVQSHPECRVLFDEIDLWNPYGALRRSEIDVLCNWLAVDEADLTVGPAIAEHRRVLNVSVGHRLASRTTVTMEDLAGEMINGVPPGYPRALEDAVHPRRTPSGRPIRRTPPISSTAQVTRGLARGEFVTPTVESVRFWNQRPGVVQIPFADLAALPLGLIWCTKHTNARLRAFAAFAAGPTDDAAESEQAPPQANIEKIDGNELRAFLTLADELHFARTAEKLHLSPSRASQLIGKLESRIGGTLFDRTSRRVQLTPLGSDLRIKLLQPYERLSAIHRPFGSRQSGPQPACTPT